MMDEQKDIFIGKEKELAVLREILGQLKVGSSIAPVNFHGEHGSGKSSLLSRLAESSPNPIPAIYIDISNLSPLSLARVISDKIETITGRLTPNLLYLMSRIDELLSLNHIDALVSYESFFLDHYGADWEQKLLKADFPELNELILKAIAHDLEIIISDIDIRGIALILDNIDRNPILPPEFLLQIAEHSRRIVLITSSLAPVEIADIENMKIRPLTKNDFYRFLRMKGLSITPAQDPPDFGNATVVFAFWANLVAGILRMGIFPKQNINLVKEELAALYLNSLDEEQLNILASLAIDTATCPENLSLISPILDGFSDKPSISPAILPYVKETAPIPKSAVNHVTTISEAFFKIRAGDYVDTFTAFNAPQEMAMLFSELQRRKTRLMLTPDIRYTIAKRVLAKAAGILELTSAAMDLIEIESSRGEFRNARDILSNVLSQITYRSARSKIERETHLAKCLLTQSSINLSIHEKDYEKALASIDTLKLYWSRSRKYLTTDDAIALFDIEAVITKANILETLHSESTVEYIENAIQLFTPIDSPWIKFNLAKLLLVQASTRTRSTTNTNTQSTTSREMLSKSIKSIKLSKGSDILLKLNHLYAITKIELDTEQYTKLEKTLFEIDSIIKTITMPDRFPKLMQLWGKTLAISGFSLFYQQRPREAASQLSHAASLLSRPSTPDEFAYMGKIYYERTRDFPQALKLYSQAEQDARFLLDREDDNQLFELLGSILIKKGKILNILGHPEESKFAMDEGIKIYRFLLKIEKVDASVTLVNLAQALLLRATISEMDINHIIRELSKAMEALAEIHPPSQKALTTAIAIGSTALNIYNRTIDKNDYSNALKSTSIAAEAAAFSQNQKLLHNVKILENGWGNFPLSESDQQILAEISQILKK